MSLFAATLALALQPREYPIKAMGISPEIEGEIVEGDPVIPEMLRDEDNEEPAETLEQDFLHSDLPLYTFEWEEIYPQNFWDEDSFGCLSRVAMGDWKATVNAGPDRWYRIHNYGVIHCGAMSQESVERGATGRSSLKVAFFAKIGMVSADPDADELWVWQFGARPGSQYLLLSRPPEEGLVEQFTILQISCPAENMRSLLDTGGMGLDVWQTSYCAINSQGELIALARKMHALPAFGILQWVGRPEADRPVDSSSGAD